MIHQKPCENFEAAPRKQPLRRDTDDHPMCIHCGYPFRSHPQKQQPERKKCREDLKPAVGTLGLTLTLLEDESGGVVSKLDPIEIRAVHNAIKIAHTELMKL